MTKEDVTPHDWEKVEVNDVLGPPVMFQWWMCKRCGAASRSAKDEPLTEVDVLMGGLSVDCDEQLVEEVHQH
jgi:hypothetical protein